MKKKVIYSEDERSYLNFATNNALARLKDAKKVFYKHFPRVLYSVAAFLVGASALAGGIVLDVERDSKEPEHYSADYNEELNYFDDSYVEHYNFVHQINSAEANPLDIPRTMEIAGGAVSLISLISFWINIKKCKEEKKDYILNMKLGLKMFSYEPKFLSFLRDKNLTQESFLELDIKDGEKLIEEFLKKYDRIQQYRIDNNVKEKL